MMQKKLLNKTCLDLFCFTLRKNLGISLIASAIVLIFSPFLILQTVNNYLSYEYAAGYQFSKIFVIGAPLLAVAACGIFVVLLYMSFSYLYMKSAGDAFHSMPIKRTQLIISKFSAAYVSSLIPLLTGYIGFSIVLATKGVVGSFSVLIAGFFYTALMMIFCGAFTLIFIISAGNLFDAIISFVAVNIGIPIISAIICSLCENRIYGFSDAMRGYLMGYSTPFAYSLVSIISYAVCPDEFSLFTVGKVIAVALIFALFMFLNFFLYKRRKCEKVTSSYAFAYMPVIIGVIISIVSYAILKLMFNNENDVISIAGVIGALLGSMIYNAVTNRGFKKIKYSFITGGIAVVLILITNFAINFDVFGYESYVPDTSDIDEVYVNIFGDNIEITKKSVATSLHEKILEAHNEDKEETSANDYITITYQMKSGYTVEREYSVPYGVAQDEKTKIINTYTVKAIKKQFEEVVNARNFLLEFGSYDAASDYGVYKEYTLSLSREAMEKFITAYCEDMRNTDYSKYFDANYIQTAYMISGYTNANTTEEYRCYQRNFVIPRGFTKTEEFMKTYEYYITETY